eukprot:6365473-Amphidinium_carterae.1
MAQGMRELASTDMIALRHLGRSVKGNATTSLQGWVGSNIQSTISPMERPYGIDKVHWIGITKSSSPGHWRSHPACDSLAARFISGQITAR